MPHAATPHKRRARWCCGGRKDPSAASPRSRRAPPPPPPLPALPTHAPLPPLTQPGCPLLRPSSPCVVRQDAIDGLGLPVASDSLHASGSQPHLLVPPTWAAQHPPPPPGSAPRRRDLPPQKEKAQKASLWTIVKESVGKDLTRVCLPVYFNEPLGALQKFAEELEYSDLLDHAAAERAGSPLRHLLVAAFAVSAYASTVNRTFKPFNPLETETYELVCHEKGFRLLSEKVSHHPTVMACLAEGRGWTLKCACAPPSPPSPLPSAAALLAGPGRPPPALAPLLAYTLPSARTPPPPGAAQRDAGGADEVQGAVHRARAPRAVPGAVPRRGGAELEQGEDHHQQHHLGEHLPHPHGDDDGARARRLRRTGAAFALFA